MATLDNLQDWLIAIAQHTRETKEAAERAAAGARERDARERGVNAAAAPAWADTLSRKIEGLAGRGAGAGLAAAGGLAARGFGGTVEAARLDYATEQLGRQFAAVMMPVMNGMTYFATQLESRMRAMGGGEQNRLMGGIVGAGIGYRLAGGAGALAGGALGARAFDEPDRYGPYAGAAAGAVIGYRLGGVYGGAAGAAAGWVAERGDYGALRRGGSSRGMAAAGAALAGLGDAGDYVAGYNPFTALPYWAIRSGLGAGSYGDWARGAMGIPTRDDGAAGWGDAARRLAAGGAGAGAAAPRRDVTPFQAQMGEAGSTYFRIQEAMIRTTAGADFEDAGPFKPFFDLLLQIFNVLAQILILNGGTAPAPAGAGGAGDF